MCWSLSRVYVRKTKPQLHPHTSQLEYMLLAWQLVLLCSAGCRLAVPHSPVFGVCVVWFCVSASLWCVSSSLALVKKSFVSLG